MGHRVADDVEPLAAAEAVHPEFVVRPLGIVAIEQIVSPLSVGNLLRSGGACDASFTAEFKFDMVS